MACDKAGLYWLPALSSEKFFGRFPACPRGTSATARHTNAVLGAHGGPDGSVNKDSDFHNKARSGQTGCYTR